MRNISKDWRRERTSLFRDDVYTAQIMLARLPNTVGHLESLLAALPTDFSATSDTVLLDEELRDRMAAMDVMFLLASRAEMPDVAASAHAALLRLGARELSSALQDDALKRIWIVEQADVLRLLAQLDPDAALEFLRRVSSPRLRAFLEAAVDDGMSRLGDPA